MQVYKEFDLSEILWYKIGGITKYFIEATSEQDVKDAFDFIFQHNIKNYFIFGMGANLLFTDNYFDGAVIHITSSPIQDNTSDFMFGNQHTEITTSSQSDINVKGDCISAFAGITLDSVIQTGFSNNLMGLEWAGGLPSTIGAAIRGNVGAFGGEIKDVTKEANLLRIIDNSYNETQVPSSNLAFSYRSSVVKKDRSLIVLSATFQLKDGTNSEIEKAKLVYNNNIFYRKQHHPDPYTYPNTGSTFKNIKEKEDIDKILTVWPDIAHLVATKWYGKVSVGYINNRLGFSGYHIGEAQVSPLHTNFILNRGKATAADVEAIIRTIQKKYQETFGFMPEPEVEIVHS